MRLRILVLLAIATVLHWNSSALQAADNSSPAPISLLASLTGDNNTISNTTTDGIQFNAKNGKGRALIRTATKFKVPLVIHARAKTSAGNIRIDFGTKGNVIPNWEKNPKELQFHDPKTGTFTGVPAAGAVLVDTWVDVVWTIDNDKTIINVADADVASFAGDYTGLAGAVGIGTSDASTVTVSTFEVTSMSTAPTTRKTRPPKAGPGQSSTDSPSPVASDDNSGPSTRLSKLQSTIKALYVIEQPSGEMLGEAQDFILTGSRGTPKGDKIPVSFTTKVGPEMKLVLDDVLRAINVKYPRVQASKFELSFADKYNGHDGGSIGAACGTLLLSLIEGFDIDPSLAMTGDVSADGKIRAIGGVAAKVRGATADHCQIVALPADNNDQVADAFVYEGPSLLTNMQLISIADLDQAVAVARVDRARELKEAIEDFGDVQQILKSTPNRIHDKDVADKLSHVLDLAPNHYSAKLLLLLSQNKQPKKLSAAATMYYTDVAVKTMIPGLTKRNGAVTMAAPAAVQDGLKKLQKVRWYADPQILNYVVATQAFMQCMSDVQQNRASVDDLKIKAQAVVNEADKLNVDRDLSEKMLREGV